MPHIFKYSVAGWSKYLCKIRIQIFTSSGMGVLRSMMKFKKNFTRKCGPISHYMVATSLSRCMILTAQCMHYTIIEQLSMLMQ